LGIAAGLLYAAGDVASWVNTRYQRRMRVEHRMNATEQGAAAGWNSPGRLVRYRKLLLG
jgi:hypothetical protein